MDVLLIKLLEEKKELAQQIYQNTMEQTSAIEKSAEQDLLSLLEDRALMLKKVDDLDERMGILSEDINDTAKDIKRSIHLLFEKIIEQDSLNHKKLEKLQKDTMNAINKLAQGKKAMTEGYMKQETSSYGYFLDKRK